MHSVSVYLVALLVIFISPTFGQMETTTEFRIKLSKPTTANRSCKTINNEDGICVNRFTCNNDNRIEEGGLIIEADLRDGGGCNSNLDEWCCAFKNIGTTETLEGISTTAPPEISRGVVPTTGPEISRGAVTTTQPEISTGVVPTTQPEISTEVVPTTQPEISTGVVPTSQPETITSPSRQEPNCLVSDQNDCPWFVKLYRSGQDYPYCLGAMIGSKTILTTATCVLHVNNESIFARVPSSANPEDNYTIISRLKHPGYNSGNRFNDLALLSTQDNINWGSGGPKGACIDPELTLGGECLAANINEYNDLDMVPIDVTQGSCSPRGRVPDAMCGNGVFNDLVDGASIMCRKNNYYVLSGITKMSYGSDTSQALLGTLDYTWLTDNLKTTAGLTEADYLFKLNYNYN